MAPPQPCGDGRLGRPAKRSERQMQIAALVRHTHSKQSRTKSPEPSSGLSFPSGKRFLSRRRLHILIRIGLELLSALLRTERILLSRKLRLKFRPFLVNSHSTYRINRHDSSYWNCFLSRGIRQQKPYRSRGCSK